MESAGFSPFLRPSAENLHDFLVAAGSSVAGHDIEATRAILAKFEVDHVRTAHEIETEIEERGLDRDARQARDGPYRLLAQLLADFLVEWGGSAPLGGDSLLAGLVFCEHILAMHNLSVTLAYPDEHLKGAVIAWCRASTGETETRSPDPKQSLTNAILGRLRPAVE
jgi:hypothetical protein